MKKLIWMVIVAVGLAALPFGGNALAGQGHKAVSHAGKAAKSHVKKHKVKHAGKKHATKHRKNNSSALSR